MFIEHIPHGQENYCSLEDACCNAGYRDLTVSGATVLCKLVVSLQMQNRKTTDKINEISIVPNPPNYSIVAIADQRALHLHFATDNQLAKPCITLCCKWYVGAASHFRLCAPVTQMSMLCDKN